MGVNTVPRSIAMNSLPHKIMVFKNSNARRQKMCIRDMFLHFTACHSKHSDWNASRKNIIAEKLMSAKIAPRSIAVIPLLHSKG